MDRPKQRMTITQTELDRIKDELMADDPKIELARSFLNLTGSMAKTDLSPELLREFGERLSNPDQLLQGPGILIWQNLRRSHGKL